eukprot:403349274
MNEKSQNQKMNSRDESLDRAESSRGIDIFGAPITQVQNDKDSSTTNYPNNIGFNQAFQSNQGGGQVHNQYMGVVTKNFSDIRPSSPRLGGLTKPRSLAPLSNIKQSSSQSKASPSNNQNIKISNDIKIPIKTALYQNGPVQQFREPPLTSNLKNNPVTKSVLKNQADAQVHPYGHQPSDISNSNSAIDHLIDKDDIQKVCQQDQVEYEIGDILDNNELSKEYLNKRQNFFNEFLEAENFVVPQGQKPSDELLEKVFKRNEIQEEDQEDCEIENINDKSQLTKEQQKQLLKYNSRNLRVFSNISWYVHDSILYNLEVKEGLSEDQFYGFDDFFEAYIGDPENEKVFKNFKNNYNGLGPFQEFNILGKELNFDYSSIKIESNIQLVLYHLPQLIKIKSIDLPIKYLHRLSKISVSSQSNIQIYQPSCVYFVYIEGKFEDQTSPESLLENLNNLKNVKLTSKVQIPSLNQNAVSQLNYEEEPDNAQFKFKRFVEQVSFNIVIYKSLGDSIINAAQLGTKGKDLQRLILTKNYWIDTYHLPVCNEYISDYDENHNLFMQYCYIANNRSVLLYCQDKEYYILSKDQKKVNLLQTNLGEVTNPQNVKKNQKESGQQQQAKKVTENEMLDISERMHCDYFIIKHNDVGTTQNSHYKALHMLKDGSNQRIDFGRIKDVHFLRMIDNFEKNKKFSKPQIQNDGIFNMTYHCRAQQQIYSFDLVNMKFHTYLYFTAEAGKPKYTLVLNTGPGSGCGYHSKYDKYLLQLKKTNTQGYVLNAFAMQREDVQVLQLLKTLTVGKIKDQNVSNAFINYIAQRSLYGSKQIENFQNMISQNPKLQQTKEQLGLTKSTSFFKSTTFRFNKNQSMLLGLAEEIPDINKIGLQHSLSKTTQLYQEQYVSDEKNKHLSKLLITPTTYVFDCSADQINHFRYQCLMGLVQGLFQQKVIFSYHFDKQESAHELAYHKVLKCNSKFIWQAYVKKNQLIFSKMRAQDYGKSVIHPGDFEHFTIRLQKGYLIREAVMSEDNKNMLIIYQFKEGSQWIRNSIIVSLKNVNQTLSNTKIENIRSVIHFDDTNLYLLQRYEEEKTHLVKYNISKNKTKKIDFSDLLRQDKYQQSYAYNHYKPQSFFHFTYKEYFILQMDYSYYMIIKRDNLEYFATFEITDKNLFLVYDNDELYFINQPPDDQRQKTMKYYQFHEGFIETILRLSIQKLHIIVDLKAQKFIIQDSEYQEISHVKIQFKNQHQTAFLHAQNCLQINDHDMVRYINELSVEQILSHFDIYDYSFLHQILSRNQKVLDSVSKKLGSTNIKEYPFIFLRNSQNLSILDMAVNFQDYFKINIIMEMIIKFQNNTYLNEIVDEHVNHMLKYKFNLKEYFESDLPMQQIQNVNYPNYSKNNSTIIYGNFKDYHTLNYIWNNYKNLVGTKVKEHENLGQVQVEYFFLNIPKTIQNQLFMKNLSSIQDLEIYETLPIQTIIDYKWNTYAYQATFKQFCYFMVFLVSYLVDIYYLIVDGQNRNIPKRIVTKIICLIYIIIMERYEFNLLRKVGFKSYIEDTWNYGDQIFAILYVACAVVDLTDASEKGLVIMHSILCFFVFIKLCSNLRVFKGFSFQMSMLKAVFYDIRYFILLYSFVIGMYGIIFSLLQIKPNDDNNFYDGVSYFGYFIMAFRASTGDSQVDNFFELDEMHIVFAWLVWVSAILFMNIILLNFIIAVISESYDKVMQRMNAESYRIKCLLIKERESYFKEKHFNNKKFFPKYMLLRRPALGYNSEEIDWQGFVKDLKNTINKSNMNQINQMKNQVDHIKSDIYEKMELIQKDQNVKQEILEQNLRFHLFETVKVVSDQQAHLDQKMDKILNILAEQSKTQTLIQERLNNGAVVAPIDFGASMSKATGASLASQKRAGFKQGSGSKSFVEELQSFASHLVAKQIQEEANNDTIQEEDFQCEETE